MPEPKKPEMTKTGSITQRTKTIPKLFVEGDKKTSLIEADRTVDDPRDTARQLRRAEIARRKRVVALDRLRAEESNREKWARFYKFSFWILLASTVVYGWTMVDLAHGDRWPMFDVWIVLVVGVLASFSGFLWYINRPDM